MPEITCDRTREVRRPLRTPAVSIVGLAIALMLAGCVNPSGTPDGAVIIDGLTFENRSGSPVDGITLSVPATGGFVSCGRIAPGALCASGFPDVNYLGYPIEIRWNQGGAEWNSGSATLQVSDEVRARGRGEVRVVVIAPGSAGALLLPSESPELP